jgi:hypothetical protein
MKILCISDKTSNPKLTQGKTYEIDARRDVLNDGFGGKVIAYYIHGRTYQANQFEVVDHADIYADI